MTSEEGGAVEAVIPGGKTVRGGMVCVWRVKGGMRRELSCGWADQGVDCGRSSQPALQGTTIRMEAEDEKMKSCALH